ncbi:response regulator [Dongia deserti]|uniref:response regulator n=1 Tax=Dongia deserti TaxID=2268030 RepID=UPI0025471962|nr:response regulator transcription factor [Dongia deserti]
MIADDHWVVREALKQVTIQLSGGYEPIEAINLDEAMAVLERNPDVGLMLLDLIMPGLHGFEGLRQLRHKHPDVPIVVISVHDDQEHVLEAIKHGVIGYIPKSAGPEEIIRSLTRVLSGEVAFPRHIIERPSPAAQPEPAPSPDAARGDPRLDVLTSRERNVLALIGKGMPVSKIAIKLSISPQTVRVHLGNAMKKLDLKNREETIHFAVTHERKIGT